MLRSTYGRQFIQISIYGNSRKREDYLVDRIKIRSNFTKNDDDAKQQARQLIERDKKEEFTYGQNVSNAFPLGDLFLDSNEKEASNRSVERFLFALFGNNELSPTKEEYGMYLAKTASLRSTDLSRQVGAVILSQFGDVVSLGSNEVPKAGGGNYWPDDANDARDFRTGVDQNQINKNEVFADIINRLFEDKKLSAELLSLDNTQAVVTSLFAIDGGHRYKDARVMDVIEYGRMIHDRGRDAHF